MAVSYGTYTITEVQEGSQIWTSSVAPTTPNYTFDVSKLVGDSKTSIKFGDIIMHSYNRYTVLSISSDGKTVLAGNLQSIRGATGAPSVTYSLIVSNLAIIKDKNGNLSPSSITVTAKSQTGSNAMANYTGRIKIETTTNNSTWTSRINEDAATKTYTIPSDTVAIRCSLYLKGGTATLLDQQTIPVVSDGIDGTNITITSTSVTYQKGTSGTVKPTGTWETGVQSVGQGEYLWTRTIVNYSDGSSTESYSVARQGNNGTNGTSPTVSNTLVEYQQSTNGKTVPTGTWYTTPPTAVAEQFMWTRTTITYSDNATAISYSVSRNGTNGTSISISSTSVTYQKGTSGTVKPTGTWETGIPSIGQGEYLWTKTVVTYSDSSKTESYSVSRNAVNGTNGTNGKDGTSPTVTSTVTEYVQSDSGTTTPTSGWNTTPPTATAGKYMWTKVTVTYSDNATAVSYAVSKNGTNGTNGINTATVYLYKKGTTAPSVPSGNTTYTFSTKKLTGTLDSWSQTIPTTGDGQCYVIAAVASSNNTTDTIGTGEWSTPIQFNGINGTNGTNGINGLNQATIFLYKRGTSVTKPTTSVTYTFSTGALSAEPNSWKRNIPTIDGNPCWVISATAIGSGTTATIAGSNWSAPVKLVEDGNDGDDAYSIVLTNENHTFAGNSTSALASEMECNVIAYKGTTQVAATIGTITGQPTGMTTSLINNGTTNAAFGVSVTTSMVTKNGVLNIPITVDGKNFTKKFTYSLALDGVSVTNVTSTNNTTDGGTNVVTITMSDGTQKTFNVKNGNKGSTGDTAEWFYGTALTHKSGTATATITGAVVGSMYLNTETSLVYKCTNINGSTMTWTYAGDLTTGVINNIEIGGRNLLKYDVKNYGITSSKIIALPKCRGMYFSCEGNQTYTISRKQVEGNRFYIATTTEEPVDGLACNIIFDENNLILKYTFTTPSTAKYVFIYLSNNNDVINNGNIKAEKGNKATDWTPAPEDIEEEVTNLRTDLQSQIDEKIQTYYQAAAPSWSSATDRTKHDGDLWYCTNNTGTYKKDRTYRYDSTTNTWVEYSATSELFDKLDGKTTVYYGTTSGTYENVEIGDYLVDGTDGSSYRWDGTNWVKVTDYQTAIDGIEDDIQDIQTNVSALQPELIIGTHGTTATATWTGTSQNLSSNDIKSGTVIQYKLSSAGKANVTLNLTLKDNTTTGAIPVYYSNTTRLGTQYGINAIVTLVYDGSTTGGVWRVLNPYTNSTYNLANRTHATAIKALEAIAKQKLICGNSTGYITIGASKTFDLSYPILYATAAITANTTSTSTCETYSSITYTTTGAIESGGANLIIYLKGTVSGNTFTIAPTNFFTTVEPTSENGFYYIPLGVMSSETAGNFVTSNRLFAYIDGAFQSVDIAATKVAVNYLSSDTTGIMVADMNDGYQIPSKATGRNVFIDSDSVDIRDGQKTLASFRGEDTKFYDVNSDNKEVASFGSNGVCVGNKNEQHFIVDTESIQAINENGSPIFSVTSTGGTITTDVVVAKGGNSQGYTLEVVLSGMKTNENTRFYVDSLIQDIYVLWSTTPFDSFYVDGETASVVCLPHNDPDTGTPLYSHHDVKLPSFLFTYGTPQHKYYHLRGTFVSNGGNTYEYTGTIHIEYDGQYRILMYAPYNSLAKTDGNVKEDVDIGWCSYIWSDIKSNLGYSKAPAMTFGTRSSRSVISPLSVTIGEELYANNENQLSIGKYNLNNDEFNPLAFVIGNGIDDTDRSNAFSVDWDGDTKISGNLTVAENIVAENINVTGRLTSDGNSGLFVLDTASIVISSIGTYASCRGNINITKSGYTPIAIAGFGITGENGWCVFPRCYITKGEPDSTIDYLNFYIWNQNSKVVFNNVTIEVKILYIASSAF